MTYIFLRYLLPLLLPVLVYAGYVLWCRQTGRTAESISWVWLLGAGVVLAALVAGALMVDSGAPRNAEYTPPRLEDGRIVPGRAE